MLSREQLASYRENGFIVLDGIYSPEDIDECSREYDDLFHRKGHQNLEATWQGGWKKETEETLVLSIHNLQNHSAVFTYMLLNEKLLESVSQILETDDILLHHSKAHVKPPGRGSPFPMHQDYHYFPHKQDSLVAVFVHLDDSDPSNGGLAVFPGSHNLGPQEDKGEGTHWPYVDQDTFPLEKAVPLPARRGQVVIFSYLLIHGSYANHSERTRRMLLFQLLKFVEESQATIHFTQLMSAHDEPLTLQHRSPGQGMVLRGRNPHCDADITRRHQQN